MNEYEFLPEVWNLIKEYAVAVTIPDPNPIYMVKLPMFYEDVIELVNPNPNHDYDEQLMKYHLVVETDGRRGNTKAYLTKNLDSYHSKCIELVALLEDECDFRREPVEAKLRGHTWRAVMNLLTVLKEHKLKICECYSDIDHELFCFDLNILFYESSFNFISMPILYDH